MFGASQGVKRACCAQEGCLEPLAKHARKYCNEHSRRRTVNVAPQLTKSLSASQTNSISASQTSTKTQKTKIKEEQKVVHVKYNAQGDRVEHTTTLTVTRSWEEKIEVAMQTYKSRFCSEQLDELIKLKSAPLDLEFRAPTIAKLDLHTELNWPACLKFYEETWQKAMRTCGAGSFKWETAHVHYDQRVQWLGTTKDNLEQLVHNGMPEVQGLHLAFQFLHVVHVYMQQYQETKDDEEWNDPMHIFDSFYARNTQFASREQAEQASELVCNAMNLNFGRLTQALISTQLLARVGVPNDSLWKEIQYNYGRAKCVTDSNVTMFGKKYTAKDRVCINVLTSDGDYDVLLPKDVAVHKFGDSFLLDVKNAMEELYVDHMTPRPFECMFKLNEHVCIPERLKEQPEFAQLVNEKRLQEEEALQKTHVLEEQQRQHFLRLIQKHEHEMPLVGFH